MICEMTKILRDNSNLVFAQQAAGAAVAIAFVAIPYVITRAVEGLRDNWV